MTARAPFAGWHSRGSGAPPGLVRRRHDDDGHIRIIRARVGDAAWASRDVVALVADDGSGRANLCSFAFRRNPGISRLRSDVPVGVTLVKHTARRGTCGMSR